jgi:hypothetical protein
MKKRIKRSDQIERIFIKNQTSPGPDHNRPKTRRIFPEAW